MPLVRRGPLFGLLIQLVLVVALATTVGLDVAGWVTGFTYGLVLWAALTRAVLGLDDRDAFGAANWVTLTRAILVGGVTVLVADSFFRPAPVALLVAIASVALVLDAIDGQVARRTATATELGARFDMEVDAFLILVLSVYVAREVGAWVLVIGAMRYAYVAASWVLPWMRGQLPPRFWRKVVAAVQGIVLTAVAADVAPRPVAIVAVAGALALLVESFGRDVWWLWRHRSTVDEVRS